LSGFPTQVGGRAWITGAGGLIGHYLARAASECAPQWEVIALKRSDLDVTDFAAVERRFRAERPLFIIHCAAMSKSPDCQANPALARTVNIDATGHLAALACDIGFIFFSTDLVFDGRKGNYIETDGVNPLSVYADTKVAAEEIVLKNPRHIVVRTSLNSGSSPKGNTAYNEQLRDGWMRGKTLQLFFDEFRCPIPAAATARATWELAALGERGIYHLAGSERLSRAQIGELAAARHPELAARMERCSLREYVGAPRPGDASLNCARIQRRLTFPLPGLTQWLRDHPDDLF
jgi:dTDP-4-dehydrorhamnose reductase